MLKMTLVLTIVGFFTPNIRIVTKVLIGTDKKLIISITAGVDATSEHLKIH